MPHSSLFYAVLVGATAGRSSSSPPDPRLTPPEPCSATGGTLSYNGICTPKEFPPRQNYSRAIPHPPYLKDPPLLINITTGRQLFVDDFLIANTSGVATAFHTAHYYDQNPVIKPDQPWEGTFAMPFSGGAWWEDDKQRLALWYRCGGGYAESGGSAAASDTTLAGRSGPSTTGTCLAFSNDGIHFNKTLHDVRPGTNMVREVAFDGNTVWLDKNERNASRRYKMADVDADQGYSAYTLLSSPDGIHWHTEINRTGTISDCSRIFYNPFRDRWVFSIKTNIGFGIGRSRGYWESPELFDPTYTRWKQNSPTGDSKTPGPGYGRWNDPAEIYPWLWADVADDSDPETKHPRSSPNNEYSQLYTVDAIAYESVMVAFLAILECDNYGKGPCPGPEFHERNEVFLAFSRDGFHFSRPPAPRLPVAWLNESSWTNWNWEDVQATAGGIIVHPELLHMYVSGRWVPDAKPGSPPCKNQGCQVDSTGLAMMRRDGFASLVTNTTKNGASSSVLTRPVVWEGVDRDALFVNFVGKGLRVEIRDADTGKAVEPFTVANSIAFTGDSTRAKMAWKGGGGDLGALAGRPVQFLFQFNSTRSSAQSVPSKDAGFYSFWVAGAKCGASGGFMAGGGPGIGGDVDTHGSCTDEV